SGESWLRDTIYAGSGIRGQGSGIRKSDPDHPNAVAWFKQIAPAVFDDQVSGNRQQRSEKPIPLVRPRYLALKFGWYSTISVNDVWCDRQPGPVTCRLSSVPCHCNVV